MIISSKRSQVTAVIAGCALFALACGATSHGPKAVSTAKQVEQTAPHQEKPKPEHQKATAVEQPADSGETAVPVAGGTEVQPIAFWTRATTPEPATPKLREHKRTDHSRPKEQPGISSDEFPAAVPPSNWRKARQKRSIELLQKEIRLLEQLLENMSRPPGSGLGDPADLEEETYYL